MYRCSKVIKVVFKKTLVKLNTDLDLKSWQNYKLTKCYVMNQARRNKDGKIVKPAAFQSHVNSGTQSRLEPSRAWFSNTKVKN